MANQNDIDRLELGVSHWNTWANGLLDRKAAMEKNRTWGINVAGRGSNKQTKGWIRDASVDFSGHKFENDFELSEFIFPCILITQKYKVPPGVFAAHKYTNFDNTEFKGFCLENANISGASFVGASIEKADFSQSNLTDANFENAVLYKASFRNTDLSRANLSGLTVEDADFSGAAIVRANFSNSKLKSAQFSRSKIDRCNFSKADLESADFSDAITVSNCQFTQTSLVGVRFPSNTVGDNFVEADLSNANLDGVSLPKCNFENTTLEGTSFVAAVLSESNFRKTECAKAIFTDAILTEARFDGAVATNATFEGAKLNKSTFQGANLNQAIFENANLGESDFRSTDLSHANLGNTELSGARFSLATLTSANMLGSNFDKATDFSNDPNVEGLKVDRYALECLKDYGGLSIGARMKLDIHDDVAILQYEYSGYKQWLHLLAFSGFIFPYLWFILKQWGRASFMIETDGDYIPLWRALGQFIYSGGNGWEQGWVFSVSFLFFIFALAYNLLKAILLAKTKRLELSQKASGLPAAFSLSDQVFGGLKNLRWKHVFGTTKFGFYVYLIVVISNLWHFFSMVIPI